VIQPIINGLNGVSTGNMRVVQETAGGTEIGKQFGDILKETMNNIGADEKQVEQMNRLFSAGQMQDVHQLFIASEKASLNLELTVQIRNKMIEAYQEIMRTQI